MKINKKQEVAMWVLGLLWTGMAFIFLSKHVMYDGMLSFAGSYKDAVALWQIAETFVWLAPIPICLIIFSLRDRKKPN